MMDAYLVTAATPRGTRWVDSIYVTALAADKRVEELKSSWGTAGFVVSNAEWWAWRSTVKLQDAVLAEATKKKNDAL